MTRRTRNIIIIVVIILLLIGAVAAYLWWRSRAQVQAALVADQEVDTIIDRQLGGSLDRTVAGNVNAAPAKPAEEPAAPVAPPAKPDESAALRRLASAFAERFGSFSNQSGYENILDLKSFMSPAMAKWADTYVADALAKSQPNPEYFGMVTRAVSAEVLKLDETAGIAKIAVTTQRREIAANGDEKLYYQVVNIDFIRTGDTWKVDAAKWGDKVNSG
jgi:hypothetical protein